MSTCARLRFFFNAARALFFVVFAGAIHLSRQAVVLGITLPISEDTTIFDGVWKEVFRKLVGYRNLQHDAVFRTCYASGGFGASKIER